MEPLDLIVIGRAGMDLYPDPPGTTLAAAERMVTDMGGSAANIAVAAARAGARVGIAAPVSDDGVGAFVAARLARHGIEHLTPRPVGGGARTSLALAEQKAQGQETVIYRNGAADLALTVADLEPHLSRARWVCATGTALAEEPSRSAVLEALVRAEIGVLDLDYRPYSWRDPEETRATYARAAASARWIVGNDEEFAVTGLDPEALAEAGHAIVSKRGADGATLLIGKARQEVPTFPVNALKPFGAGDAFLGTGLAGLIAGAAPLDAFTRGAAAAAIVVARTGCAGAMPTPDEIDHLMESHDASSAV